MAKEDLKVSRRQAIGNIVAGAFGLLLDPIPFTRGRPGLIRLALEQEPCDKADLSANARPHFKIGQTFRYKTLETHDTNSSITVTTESVSADRIEMKGELIPLEQTITVQGKRKYGKEECFVIRRKASVQNPLYQASSEGIEKTAELNSIAYVSEMGKVVYSESKLVTKQGSSTSVSITKNEDPPVYSTLYYFYGYWMLALTKSFSWECTSNDTDGQFLRRLRVAGFEKVEGDDCFIVESTVAGPENKAMTTYWVDSKERIVRQAKIGEIVLKRAF